MNAPFLLYGSYGYTGRIIAELAVQRGLQPILAGRNPARLHEQASQLGLQSLAFPLDDPLALDSALSGASLILLAAGPFQHTYPAVAAACLRTGRHYLDITGEIAVFEGLARMDAAARQAGVMLLPGVGFDVVPSDCLAAHLKGRLPDATQLTIAIRSLGGGTSHGTALTMLEGIHLPGAVRRNGRLESRPLGSVQRSFNFGRGPRPAVSIPWGDISTAYWSTKIPNIDTFMAFPPALTRMLRFSAAARPLLKLKVVKSLLAWAIKSGPAGPSPEQRRTGRSQFYAEVLDEQNNLASALLETPEGYSLTSLTSLLVVEKVLQGRFTPGYQTPSTAYGKDLILEIPNTRREDIG